MAEARQDGDLVVDPLEVLHVADLVLRDLLDGPRDDGAAGAAVAAGAAAAPPACCLYTCPTPT